MAFQQYTPYETCREKYNRNEQLVFDCIASYFTEIFYIHCYNEARKLKEDYHYPQINSVTVGYKHSLRAWEKARKEKKFYRESIKGVIEKLKLELKGMMSYNDAISMMVEAFIPDPTEWGDLSAQEQNNILGTVIQNCVKEFIVSIMNKHIVLIIDKRGPKSCEIIQENFLQIVMDIKEYTESHIRIAMKEDNPHNKNIITQETYNRLKKLCSSMIAENNKHKKIIGKLQEIIKFRKTEYETLKMETYDLRNTIDRLTIENRSLKETCSQKSEHIKPNIVAQEFIDKTLYGLREPDMDDKPAEVVPIEDEPTEDELTETASIEDEPIEDEQIENDPIEDDVSGINLYG